MNCNNCKDTGYTFDTLHACPKCDLGKPIQHQHDKDELERHLVIANTLRVKILTYENNGKADQQTTIANIGDWNNE